MAETALYLALRKIHLALGLASLKDHYSYEIELPKFQSRLRRIEGELRMILCFLDQLETRYNSNKVLVSWIAESQRLGYLVEETVDVLISNKVLVSWIGESQRLRYLVKEIVDVLIHHLFGRSPRISRPLAPLIELEEELQHLSKLKENWLQLASDSEVYIPITCEAANVFEPDQLVSDFSNEELVGFDDVKKKLLTDRLKVIEDSASKVVAVWGPAGSGKTTLVRSVYEHQKLKFESYAWISVSRCSSAENIWTEVKREVTLKYGRLPEKNFLIVLDDMKVKDGISEELKRINGPGSRLIIITRIEMVAEIADEKINLPGLEGEGHKAVELFGKVLGKGTIDSVDKYKNVMKIFPQCQSLPQVIVSLGATLCLNQSTDSAFQHLQDQLKWVSKYNSSLDDTRKCLYVAYINLPMHLKVCLLYCGIFPAGYLLQREKLVRLWVAEGFIKKQRESQVEEDIAEDYVMALTSWGFLQYAGSDQPARVGANLRMPIVVHDLVQSISRKEGFGIASEDAELAQDDTNIRCLFTSKYPQDILKHLPHLRTLIVSETGVLPDPYTENLVSHLGLHRSLQIEMVAALMGMIQTRRFSYLSVLELHGSPLEDLPSVIDELFNLRYLGLSKTKVRALPSSITRLHNMQTLDVEATNITELPKRIHELARLRHILAGSRNKGVRASKRVMKLKELQTLETVEASADFTNNIVGSLTQIRSIGISEVEGRNSETLFSKLSLLGSLSSLAVSANSVNVDLPVGSLIQKQLKYLELSTCKLTENAVQLLGENLSNLVSLTLNNISGITEMEFQKIHFTKLRTINLQQVYDVRTLQIPQDALANLQVLHVEGLDKLEVVEDFVKIGSVKDLFFPSHRDEDELRKVRDKVKIDSVRDVLGRNDVAESSRRNDVAENSSRNDVAESSSRYDMAEISR